MSTGIHIIRILKTNPFKTSPAILQPTQCLQYWRSFADKPKSNSPTKQVVVHGAHEEERLRVRRARPADVPKILRFVRESARIAWPDFISQHTNFNLILEDYVARALAQGHSMLAEQQEPKHGWSQIRGLAISTKVCPWDAMMLEQWARCVKCKKSQQFVHFTAYCLRAPGLHDKYRVHNILQVVLLVPPDIPKASEIVHMLAKHTIKRGREVGIPVLRFDVTNDSVAKVLDDLNLIKEWELSYNVPLIALEERKEAITTTKSKTIKTEKEFTKDENLKIKPQDKDNCLAVYTANNHITKL